MQHRMQKVPELLGKFDPLLRCHLVCAPQPRIPHVPSSVPPSTTGDTTATGGGSPQCGGSPGEEQCPKGGTRGLNALSCPPPLLPLAHRGQEGHRGRTVGVPCLQRGAGSPRGAPHTEGAVGSPGGSGRAPELHPEGLVTRESLHCTDGDGKKKKRPSGGSGIKSPKTAPGWEMPAPIPAALSLLGTQLPAWPRKQQKAGRAVMSLRAISTHGAGSARLTLA